RGNWRRFTLLSELGRIPDVDLMVAVARHLGDLRPTVREGIAIVRRCRLQATGRTPKSGSAGGLLAHLARALNGYRTDHPDVSDETAVLAVEGLATILRDTSEPGDGEIAQMVPT